MLVVGIALFLGYISTNVGPAGRVGVGYAVSMSLLLTGVALERLPRYKMYAWGLIGGGWAALYFTTYAVHALPAARLVEDPLTGILLLSAVAAGMILHSFRYKSETVTGLAFCVAFVTLGLSPLVWFTTVASVPLVLALLLTSYRLNWTRLAVGGAVLTYLVYALKGEAYPVVWAAWLAFEAFDVIDLKRRPEERDWMAALMPLNACGLLGIALLESAPLDVFLFQAAAGYAASALARRFLRDYEPAAGVAAALLVWGTLTRFHGFDANYVLLVVAEIIAVAGILTRDRFLTWLGAVVLAVPAFKLVFVDNYGTGWTQAAAVSTALALVDSYLAQAVAIFPCAATLLITASLYHLLPGFAVAPAWALFALGLLALDRRLGLQGLRYHSYALALLAFVRACGQNLPNASQRVAACAAVILCYYSSQFLTPRGEFERPGFSILGTALLTLLVFAEVSGRVLTIACGFEGLLLLAAGFLTHERVLRLSGLALFFFCIGKVFFWDLSALDTLNRILSFIVLGLLLLGVSWIYTRFREQIRRLL